MIAILLCPVCSYADDVTMERLPGSLVRNTCANRHPDGHDFIWEMSSEQASGGGGDRSPGTGVTADLYDPMLHCVLPDEPFVEYGIVEYRLSQQFPELYRAHIAERGHVMLEPSRVTASNSRFVPTLVRRAANGLPTRVFGKATGAWSYNGRTTYWARPGAPTSHTLTWEEYCENAGRPAAWTTQDRQAAAG